jgi:predicted 2-oxoglutarate/Fe(II)-dependent dioxygenase YbiX
MIKIYRNFIKDAECNELIYFFQSNKQLIIPVLNDNLYHFNGIDILNKIQNFSFTKRFLNINNIDRLRIQHVDNQINVVEKPHGHFLPYSFVIFLNDNFEGGELLFNNITIKPQKGQFVYFTGDEIHNVTPVTCGDRYTLVSFLFSDIKITDSKLI